MSHVHTTCTKKPWLPSGLVFDRMLSEWLISQCFDLLQLLELCLVRAWIWHTLQIIMWLHYTQCFFFFCVFFFFFFQFSFWRDIFFLCFKVLQFWYHTWLFYTTNFTIRHLLNEKKKKNEKMQRVIFLQLLYGYYWLVLMNTFSFFFFFSLHWVDCLTPTNTMDLPSMLRKSLFWNMNHVGAQNCR